eukprot:PhM_4_TR13363/c2_g1_i4/m.64974
MSSLRFVKPKATLKKRASRLAAATSDDCATPSPGGSPLLLPSGHKNSPLSSGVLNAMISSERLVHEYRTRTASTKSDDELSISVTSASSSGAKCSRQQSNVGSSGCGCNMMIEDTCSATPPTPVQAPVEKEPEDAAAAKKKKKNRKKEQPVAEHLQVYKTELCEHGCAEACPAGQLCQHAHGPHERRTRHINSEVVCKLRSGGKRRAVVDPTRFKVKMCEHAARCSYGANCMYAHHPEELRSVAANCEAGTELARLLMRDTAPELSLCVAAAAAAMVSPEYFLFHYFSRH